MLINSQEYWAQFPKSEAALVERGFVKHSVSHNPECYTYRRNPGEEVSLIESDLCNSMQINSAYYVTHIMWIAAWLLHYL